MKTSASNRRRAVLASALAFAVWVAPRVARADEPDAATTQTAVQLANEAADFFKGGRFGDALDRYQRAFELVHRQTIGVRMARCLAALGRLNEAAERYLAVTRMPLPGDLDPDKLAKQKEAMAQAESERAALLPRIPSVVVSVTGPRSTRVTLDGRPLPPALFGERRAADPGPHHVEARAGDAVVVRDLTLAEGQVAAVPLELPGTRDEPAAPIAPGPAEGASAPAARSPSLRLVGYAATGAGAAGLVVGTVSGLLAMSKKSDLEGACGPSLACPPSRAGDASSYNTERTISSVGFVVGGALAAVGVTLVVIGGGSDSAKANG